jgi:hypothetical protein
VPGSLLQGRDSRRPAYVSSAHSWLLNARSVDVACDRGDFILDNRRHDVLGWKAKGRSHIGFTDDPSKLDAELVGILDR